MDDSRCGRRAGFTRKEFLVVIGVVAVLFGLMMGSAMVKAREKSKRIQCVGRLKNIGLGYRIYATDSGDMFPWERTNSFGARIAFLTNDFLAHFRAISNELSMPLILYCPADKSRKPAKDWLSLSRANVGYFLGLNASETYPQSILAGDCNLTVNGKPIASGMVRIPTNAVLGFDRTRHRSQGNVALGDGSVQQLSMSRLNAALGETGMEEMVFGVP